MAKVNQVQGIKMRGLGVKPPRKIVRAMSFAWNASTKIILGISNKDTLQIFVTVFLPTGCPKNEVYRFGRLLRPK